MKTILTLLLSLTVCCLALAAEPIYSCGEAISYENLTIYPIYAKVHQDTSHLITLEEALEKKLVTVQETGNVNELAIQVNGDVHVYIQAGDVVKGGKQDRTIGYDMIVSQKSGKVPLKSFCVEQGRWQKRGKEAVNAFQGSKNYVIGNALKSAIRDSYITSQNSNDGGAAFVPQVEILQESLNDSIQLEQLQIGSSLQSGSNTFGGRANGQNAVWAEVKSNQIMVLNNSSLKKIDLDSESSLQLTMEHEKTRKAVKGYEDVLDKKMSQLDQPVGFAFSINGQLNSAEIYASHNLFKRMWAKLLLSAATEALSLKDKPIVEKTYTTQDIDQWINKPDTYKKQYNNKAAGCENTMYHKEKERCYDSQYEVNNSKELLHRTMLK